MPEKCALFIHAMERFGHKKEGGINIYYNLREPGKCVIRKKPERKSISCVIPLITVCAERAKL